MVRRSSELRKASPRKEAENALVSVRRRSTVSKSEKGRFLPRELSNELSLFLKKNVRRLIGLWWICFGIVLFLSLMTYHHSDPSWNFASQEPPQNLLHLQGAYVADLCFQFLGAIAFLLPFPFLFFGGWVLRSPIIPHFKKRLYAFIGGIILGSLALGGVDFRGVSAPFLMQWGGVLGILGYRALFFSMHGIISSSSLLTGLLGGSSLLFLGYSFALRFKTVFRIGMTFLIFCLTRFQFSKARSLNPLHEDVSRKNIKNKQDTPYFSGTFLSKERKASEHNDFLSTPLPQQDDSLQNEPHFADDSASYFSEEFSKPSQSTPSSRRTRPVREEGVGEDYTLPSVTLLDQAPPIKLKKVLSLEMLDRLAGNLHDVLEEFGVKGDITDARAGPVVTLYELKPAAGIKTSRVIGLSDDIARSMSALSARIAVIPGRNVIGIELPNPHRETVYMRELLESDVFDNTSAILPLILGKDIGGQPIIADLTRMPHLLVAGTTGSGKSVSINTMILSLLYRLTPHFCKFIMIDPKMLELSVYDGIPHLLCPVVTDPKKAIVALRWAVKEMESRYRAMAKLGVRNIDGYNTRLLEAQAKGDPMVRRVQIGFDPDSGKPIFENQSLALEFLPYIVIVVDEMADLMMVAGKEIEAAVQRLAQMARAAGIHLIMATQRPSVDVITGTIKANFPTRISFQVTSKIDSRTILGEQGAEQLLGQGDMLYMAGGGRITRLHGPFVRDDEVEKIVKFLKSQGEPSYLDDITKEDEMEEKGLSEESGGDALYRQAVELVLREGKASTSFVQRHLQIGYNRAAKIIEQMEKSGIVSPANHVGKREILGN